ncbi:MAG TPA: hypothetical protein VFS78_19695 [Vicinamibacteria bacterium]|nr:hypothetical protein [Vicinamibacteria bacterium]
MACVLAGALGVPVVISIAGALEAQAPALARLLAWAVVAERACAVVSDRRTRGQGGGAPPRAA